MHRAGREDGHLGAQSGERVHVVLEDVSDEQGAAETAGPAVPSGPSGPSEHRARVAGHGRRASRWPVWAGAAVVVALAVATAVMTATDEARDRERREALAGIAGLLPHLDGPPEEAWSVSDGWALAVGRDVVVLTGSEETTALRGIDLRTGSAVWTRPVAADETCVALSDDSSPLSAAIWPAVAERLACFRTFATVEGYGVVVGGPASVEVLDVSTGGSVAVVPTPADVLGVEVSGSDVLVASLDADGAVLVSRWTPGPAAGSVERIWSRRLAEPLESIEETGWAFHVEAEVARVGTVGSVPLDLATGEPRPDAARDGVLFTVDAPLAGGGRVEWDYDDVAQGTGVSRVVPGDGGDVLELDGVPWVADVRDGSEPGVLMLRRPTSVYDAAGGTGEVVAVDPATGADLWSGGRMGGMDALVQLDGVLVAAGAGRVLALDVRDGDVVWEEDAGGVSSWPEALTDGDVVLLPQVDGGELALVARDLRTGAEQWRMPLGPLVGQGAQVALEPTAAGILVLSGARIALLAPPA